MAKRAASTGSGSAGRSTPILAWPRQRFRGAPGYSAKHFSALSGGSDDPLSAAETIAAYADAKRIGLEARAKLAAGEDYDAVLDWQTTAITQTRTARWNELCSSFDKVLEWLQSVPQTPPMRRLVRAALASRKV